MMKIHKFGKNGVQITSFQGSERLLFIPALFFVLLGVLAIVAPKLLLFLIASTFLFVGLVAAVLAYKFLTMKRKLETMVKDLSGKVVVQSARPRSPFELEEDLIEQEHKKKVVFH